jgi:amino acid adenylation domain-containing protein
MPLAGSILPLPETPLVHREFEAHARSRPDSTALTCGASTLTFAELNARANRFAHRLIAEGVGPGALVGVCLDRSAELMAAILGVLKSGAAYVPLDPAYPADRLRLMTGQLHQLGHVVASSATAELVGREGAKLLVVEEAVRELAGEPTDLPSADPDVPLTGDDLCYVVYTSGSTGRPKATAVRHEGWYNLLHWLRTAHGLGTGSSGLTVSSFGFDISQRALMAPLFTGAPIHLLPSRAFDPAMAYRLIAEYGVKTLHCAPSTLYVLIEQEQALGTDALTGVDHVFIGGEPLNAARVRDWAERKGNTTALWHQYGVAECTDVATAHLLSDFARYEGGPAPVGTPVHNTVVHVLDEEGRPVPDGGTGEICISGLGVGAGYLGGDGAGRESFTELATPTGPVRAYRTGDRGRLTAQNGLVVVGRTDAQVKINGMRIELGDVEHQLRANPRVSDAAVVAVPDIGGGPDAQTVLVAYVVPAGTGQSEQFDGQALRAELLRVMPRNMVPRRLVPVDSFPLNPNGKTDRRELAAQAAGHPRTNGS